MLLLLVGLAIRTHAAHDVKLARQIGESWRGYQDIIITGTVKFYRDGVLEEEERFKAIYGHSNGVSGSRPISVGTVVRNPGEPHIQDDELFDVNCSVKDGLAGRFLRSYISQPAPSFVYSEMQMFPGEVMIGGPKQNDPINVVHSALHPNLLSASYSSSGVAEKGWIDGQYWHLEIVGEEEFQGISAKRVRATAVEPHLPDFLGTQVEMLVALEPSVLVLKFIDAKGGKSESFRTNTCRRLRSRELLEVKLWDGRLIPVVTKYEEENVKAVVEVQDVISLPPDFHGLWEFDGPTGTRYIGDLEPAVRKRGIHEPYARASSLITFSLAEQEQIRKFLAAKKIIQPRGISWARLAVYAINLIAIAYIANFIWSRIRQNQ